VTNGRTGCNRDAPDFPRAGPGADPNNERPVGTEGRIVDAETVSGYGPLCRRFTGRATGREGGRLDLEGDSAFLLLQGHCFRITRSDKGLTHLLYEPVVWKGPWRDVKGEGWMVEPFAGHRPDAWLNPINTVALEMPGTPRFD
jgi:hypothetical protein